MDLRNTTLLAVAAGAALLLAGVAYRAGLEPPGVAPFAPGRARDQGYVSSDTCRSCHPSQHASWHRSFHRSMTQVATPAALAPPFERHELSYDGVKALLEPRDGVLWADMVDPVDLSKNIRRWMRRRDFAPQRLEGPVVLLTGSHHAQMFWVMGPDRVYRLFPFVWLVEEQRFVPEGHSFLHPPIGYAPNTSRWDEICIHCHASGAQPGLGATSPAPRAGELGIACEACHGPAAEHVAANRNPLRRYWLHLRGAPDPTIVNPATLPPKLSASVCGQCHSYHVNDADPERGHSFRPGKPLEPTFRVARFETTKSARQADHFFWQDGTMRVTGREYNGLLETGCFTRGEMACVSCHSIHESDPNDQLARDKLGDAACLQCHGEYAARIEAHTHHPPGSSGAECMNCHMPHTSYGMLGAIRSHRIDSPSARTSAELGRPNACNLCHVGESLGWAADHLTAWYGQPPVALSPEQRELAAGVLWLLRGDAAQRGILAWNMGWEASRAASPGDWQTLFLALTLDDPYPAVRSMAGEALRKFDAFRSFDYDYVPEARRQGEAVARALRSAGTIAPPKDAGLRALFDGTGRLDRERVDRLRAERDDRRVMISE